MAELPEAATVELLAPGGSDLMLDVLAPDLATVHRFVDDELAALPDVLGVECVFATSLYAEGSRWRLGSLDASQLSALGRTGTADGTGGPLRDLTPVDRVLLDALARDGRTRLTDLAGLTGTSAATVRRRLHRLTAGGIVGFRCDVAPVVSGLPVSVTFRGRAPAPTSTACTAPSRRCPSAGCSRRSPEAPTCSPPTGCATSARSSSGRRRPAPNCPRSTSPSASSVPVR